MQTVAEHLATALARRGISTAFGIPGGETLSFLEALHSAGFRFVLTRHETAAGLMAEGLHHATGAPGLLVATVGPGAANCPNAVAQASLDRVPLVVVTGNVAASHGGQFT
ncbi:MAG: thiamine pyrophosphate-binding protein, partial [Myxococcota bacterium]